MRDDLEHESYYRIIKETPYNKKDFLPVFWAQPSRQRQFQTDGERCDSQGMSCFATLEEAIAMQEKFRGLGRYIVKGFNLHLVGKVKNYCNDTFPTHMNFYIYRNKDEITDIEWEQQQ